jgi:hypothetical protein
MTIDERIDAIAQSVELFILENRDRENKWEKRFGFIGESLEKLAHIAELHQHRLDSHDDRLDNLEGTA